MAALVVQAFGAVIHVSADESDVSEFGVGKVRARKKWPKYFPISSEKIYISKVYKEKINYFTIKVQATFYLLLLTTSYLININIL